MHTLSYPTLTRTLTSARWRAAWVVRGAVNIDVCLVHGGTLAPIPRSLDRIRMCSAPDGNYAQLCRDPRDGVITVH